MVTKKELLLKLRELEDERWNHVLSMGYFVSSLGCDATRMWQLDVEKNLIAEVLGKNSDETLGYLTGRIEATREQVLLRNQALVNSIVKKWLGVSIGIIDAGDMFSYGMFGLMRAVDRFDVERDLQFSTYASPWIKSFIYRAISNYGFTVRNPVRAEELIKVVSIEETRGGALSIGETLAAKVPEDRAHYSGVTEERVHQLIYELSPVSEKVVRGRFFENKTLREIGKDLGLSRERVRQLQEIALDKMRVELGLVEQ